MKYIASVKRCILCGLVLLPVLVLAQSAVDLNNQALRLLDQFDYEKAIQILETAREKEPAADTIRVNLALACNNWGIELAKTDDYEKAVGLLEKARALAPERADVARNLSVIRSNWAIGLSAKGRYEEAEAAFVKSAETAPEADHKRIDQMRAENQVAQARAERVKRGDAHAKRLLERAIEIYPDTVSALVDLGKILYEEGDSFQTLSYWERANELQPNIPGLAERIEKLKREVETEKGFEKKENLRFRVSYEGAVNDEVARAVLGILSQAYRDIGGELRLYPDRRIDVVLYTKEQFANVTMAPHWSGAVYDGKIRVPVAGGPLTGEKFRALREMLYHEYTHALVISVAGPDIASWFNEGLATYYELDARNRQKRYAEEWQSVRALLTEGRLPSMQNLPAYFTAIAGHKQAAMAYLVSRTFVTWLGGPARAYKFKTVLQEIAKGASLDDAFVAAYGMNVSELENRWHSELMR